MSDIQRVARTAKPTRGEEIEALRKVLDDRLEEIVDFFDGFSAQVWVELTDLESPGAAVGYTKHKGEWDLYVRRAPNDEPVALLLADEDLKIAAVGKLADLYNQLVKESKKLLEKLKRAVAAVEAVRRGLAGK